jgi:hypothetical protein
LKKALYLLILTITLTTTSNAQALLILLFGNELSTPNFQMGINASGAASTISGLSGADYRISWAFGAFGEYKLSPDWFLHFNLTLKTPGGAKNVNPLVPIPPEVDSLYSNPSVSRSLNYITLPVFIKYRISAFKIGLGAQVGYLTSAEDTYDAITYEGNEMTVVSNIRNELNEWDAGLTGLIDFYFETEKGLMSYGLSLTYYYGLTDMLKNNNGDSWNNSVFILSMIIPIGGHAKSK